MAELKTKTAPSFIDNKNLRLILFGGKGGVGKTTASAAIAVYLARENPKREILVVSTDPAHSLGDSLDCPLGGKALPIEGINNLWGLEVDAPALMADYKARHREAMRKIADRGTLLDNQQIGEFLELTLPGLDEMMAVIQMADIIKDGTYDLIIMDTAPTGHTLRLLGLPQKMRRLAEVLDLMQAKHRYISKVFTGRYIKDDADAFTEQIISDVDRVNALFKDKRVTEFVPVMIPEPMSIYETGRLVATLNELRIPANNIVINRVARKEDCVFCLARQRDQQDHISQIENMFGSYNLIKMPLFPYEIRGIEALTKYAQVLTRNDFQYSQGYPVEPTAEITSTLSAKLSDLLERSPKLLIFGGKGGVGKTTSAAATALTFARHNLNWKVIIFSTDPAHSLSDSFDYPIGDKLTQIEANLYAVEIDADKLWADFVRVFKADVKSAFDRTQARLSTGKMGGEVVFDKDVMIEMVDASPPGIDEIMALESMVDRMNEGEYDLFILDTAPTGHLLRLLEMPELVRNWLKTIFRVLISFQRVMPLTYLENLNKRLIKLSKGSRMVIETLINPRTTEFVAVTIPEAMGILEMDDLLASLNKLQVPCRHIIINKVIPYTNCNFCSAKRAEQDKYIHQVRGSSSVEYLITEAPLFPHQIRGLSDLTEYADKIF